MSPVSTGLPPEAITFFQGLVADNSRTYWQANRATWEQCVREPMAQLLDSLPDRYGPWYAFRPHRDVRFGKDKSPYKTMHGAASETEGGAGHYLHVSAEGVLVAAGMYAMARDQLARFRAAVADDTAGPALERILARLRAAGVAVGSGHDAPLGTAPRGYPRDHPRIALLRWKGCIASAGITDPAVLHGGELRAALLGLWRRCDPLLSWLETHVGPTTEPPEERRPAGRR